jgi:dTDP-4-amino-4,6-dideoxygalactose transaminase
MPETRRIPLSEPYLAGNVRTYLEECIATNFVSSVGPFVDRFEARFADYVGAKFAVACSSGTAAIHLALRLIGVETGDEVFVPTLTFVASVNPVLYQGGVPTLVDSEAVTWNLDPTLIADELDRRARAGKKQPKAVEVVHLLGHPVDLQPIAEACERHGVVLIEDAAEALGARYTAGPLAGRHVGTVGKMGCFSFNGNKIITTGGGGMLTTDDETVARRAKHLTTQARLPGLEYRHDEVGYNYRLSNLSAALGMSQLELLDDFVAKKVAIARRYDECLRAVDGVELAPRTPWASSTHWLYTIRVRSRAARGRGVIDGLRAAGIESRPIWSPLHSMDVYAGLPRIGGGVAEEIFSEAVSLPSSVTLSAEEQDIVIDRLGSLLSRREHAR